MEMNETTLRALWGELRKAPGFGRPLLPPEIAKAINQATGLVWYDLEPYAKLLFPVITPLRNEIPRVPGDGGTATHWVSIIGINVGNTDISLAEGQRGGQVTTNVQQNVATYKSFGLDDSVTFEADLAAKNFDDVKRLAVDNLLRAVFIGEEQKIVGGRSNSLAGSNLGITPTPSVSDAGQNKGTINAATLVSVICVALAYDGFQVVKGAAQPTAATTQVPGAITRTNTDNSSTTYGGGSAQKSPAGSATTANDGNNTHGINATVTAVNGAVAYAWFWGTAGGELLGAVTTINSVLITTATGTANGQLASSLPSSDNSQNIYALDGLLTQITSTGSGSYIATQATGTAGTGTPLTADGAGGIVEIDTALRSFWDNSRLSPQVILVSSQELNNITKKVVAGGAAPLFRFVSDVQDASSAKSLQLTAGTIVGNYLNKFTMAGGSLVQVLLHPNVPPGTIIFYSRQVPYPLSNVRNILQMKMRRDYYQLEWPIVRPQYEYSVWANGLLQNYFTPAFGIITNIGNG